MSLFLPLPTIDETDPNQGMYRWLAGLLYGGKCIGYEEFDVTDLAVKQLTIPVGAQSAIIYIQGDGTVSNSSRVVQFREDGNNPSTNTNGSGMPLPDNGVYECDGFPNLEDFRIIGIEAGKTHRVRVQYYGTGK